jgi:hypothetical protein
MRCLLSGEFSHSLDSWRPFACQHFRLDLAL